MVLFASIYPVWAFVAVCIVLWIVMICFLVLNMQRNLVRDGNQIVFDWNGCLKKNWNIFLTISIGYIFFYFKVHPVCFPYNYSYLKDDERRIKTFFFSVDIPFLKRYIFLDWQFYIKFAFKIYRRLSLDTSS